MDTVSPITVVENNLGEEITLEEVADLWSLSLAQRSELYGVLEQFYGAYESPAKKSDSIRLLLHGTGPGRFGHLFSPWAGDSGDLGSEVQQFTSEVANFLLYCHTLVLPDPLTRFFSTTSEYRQNRRRSFTGDHGFKRFVAWFAMIVSLKELIQAGVVHLFPEVMFNEEDFPKSERLSHRDMEDATLMQLARKLSLDDLDSDRIRGIPIPVLGINNMLLQCQRTESSLIAPNQVYYDLVTRKLDLVGTDLRTGYGIESRAIHSLRNITVPVFRMLDHRDLIQIRKNDELFHRWRMDLSALLSALESSPFEEATNAEEIRRKADEMLYAKYLDLRDQFSSGSVLSSLKSGVAKFGIGTLVIYALTGSLAAALAAAGGAETVNVLYDFFFKGVGRDQRALLKHYAVFFETSADIEQPSSPDR